jgi:diaminopimelate decarboxylase
MTKPTWFDTRIENALVEHISPEHEQGYFVYQLDALKEHLAKLQQQNVVKLWFAVKANPLSKVIQTLDGEGFNFDVASSGELAQVLAQGIEPSRVLNTGPAKSKKQLSAFINQGVGTFVVESLNQLIWLNEVVNEKATLTGKLVKPKVLLRVQLQWDEGEKKPSRW